MRHRLFDRSRLLVRPLRERAHDLELAAIADISQPTAVHDAKLALVAQDIVVARRRNSAVILFIGGHVIRAGVQRYIIDLMERGFLSCLAMNGAGMIHDFEFAMIGATTESVARYIKAGQFGLWNETGRINDVISAAYKRDDASGMGSAIGEFIEESSFPAKSISVLAAAWRLKIPATVHVGIGYDIIHEHPNCDGAATGALSYNDFLALAAVVEGLEGGVVMNFGSAVMAPEVYLKALSMARNVAFRAGKEIRHFTTLVCDLVELPQDLAKAPAKDCPAYYFRPLKTMLIRTVADGGGGHYVRGNHGLTMPALWSEIVSAEAREKDRG